MASAPAPAPAFGDSSTHLSSLQSLAEISRFLKEAVADSESRQLRDGMGALAQRLEALVAEGLQHGTQAERVARLTGLQELLQQHHAQLVALGPDWRGLYEYGAYLASLHHFRGRIDTWVRELRDPAQPALWAPDFELLSWRMLGAGMLLLDVYEQWGGQEQETIPEEAEGAQGMPAQQRRWWQLRRR